MKNRWAGLMGILTGMGVSAVMQTLLSVSMPSVVRELGGMQLYNWVFGSYMLASSVTIPLFARMADILGRKLFYMSGLGLFAAGTLMSGISAGMPMLIAGRALMGIGAGAITPSAVAMIGEKFNEEEFPKIFGITGVVQIVSNVLGPLLGGFMTDVLSWRWGFILLIPFELACGLLVQTGIVSGHVIQSAAEVQTPVHAGHKQGFAAENIKLLKNPDWLGALLLSAGLAGVILGLQMISRGHVAAGAVLAVAALLALITAIRWEGRCPMPILPVKLIKEAQLGSTAVFVFLLGIVNNSAITYLSLFYQDVLGRNASVSGILLLPMLAAAGLGSIVCGRADVRKQRKLIKLSWLFIGAAFFIIIPAGRIFNGVPAVMSTVPAGFGLGFLLPVFISRSQYLPDGGSRASSGGLVQLSRNLGGTIGVTLLGIWVSDGISIKTGLNGIFACLAATGFAALMLSLRNTEDTGISLEADGS